MLKTRKKSVLQRNVPQELRGKENYARRVHMEMENEQQDMLELLGGLR